MALEMPGPDFLLDNRMVPLKGDVVPFNSGIQSWEDFYGAMKRSGRCAQPCRHLGKV